MLQFSYVNWFSNFLVIEVENKACVPHFTKFKFQHFGVGKKKNANLLFLLFTQKRQQLEGTVLPTEN